MGIQAFTGVSLGCHPGQAHEMRAEPGSDNALIFKEIPYIGFANSGMTQLIIICSETPVST